MSTLMQKNIFQKENIREDEEDEETSGQAHAFTFYKELSQAQRMELDSDWQDLEREFGIELTRVDSLYAEALIHQDRLERANIHLEAPNIMNWDLKKPPQLSPGANVTKLFDVKARKQYIFRKTGLEMYLKGRVAMVVLSGGMDGRFTDNLPKGIIDIGLLSGKSIFQLYAERVQRLQHMVQRQFKQECPPVPWYVMCNRDNMEIIQDFFEENDFFGLRGKDVMFFAQKNHPAVDKKGKILLAQKHKILQFPCGNGGMFQALLGEGAIADMKNRNVSYLYICSIDNVLAKIGDPTFLGCCNVVDAQCCIKCVEVKSPDESYGILCTKTERRIREVEGVIERSVVQKANVFEYFEMPEDLKKKKVGNTQNLLYSCGNLSQYVFKLDFVRHASPKMRKCLHLIPKQLSFVNTKSGEMIHQDEKDSLRFESWIFDACEYTSSVLGFEVPRHENAFVKKPTGHLYSLAAAVDAVSLLHQHWILHAGGSFLNNKTASNTPDALCEVSPLVSYQGEDLEQLCLAPIALPFYLPSHVENFDSAGIAPIHQERQDLHFVSMTSSIAQMEQQVYNHEEGPAHSLLQSVPLDYNGERADDDEQLPPTAREEEAEAKRAEELARAEREAKKRDQTAMDAFLAGDDEEAKEGEEEEEEEKQVSDKNKPKGLEVDLFLESHQRLRRKRVAQEHKGVKQSILGTHQNRELIGGAWFRNTGRQTQQQYSSNTWWKGDSGSHKDDDGD